MLLQTPEQLLVKYKQNRSRVVAWIFGWTSMHSSGMRTACFSDYRRLHRNPLHRDLLSQRPPFTEAPFHRDPLHRDPLHRDPISQRSPSQRPLLQKEHRTRYRDPLPAQKEHGTRQPDPLDRMTDTPVKLLPCPKLRLLAVTRTRNSVDEFQVRPFQ